MENDTSGSERNLGIILRSLLPVEDGLNVVLLDGEVIAVTDSTLKENTNGIGQAGCRGHKNRAC